MNTKQILFAALLAGMFAPAMAEDAEDADLAGQPSEKRVMMIDGEAPDLRAFDALRFSGPLMLRTHGRVVRNAPYSAESVSERQRNLADGNQIVNKTSSMSYRDSAGSTRQEMRNAKGELRNITIHNVTDGATYILKPQDKSATRIAADPEIGKAAADAAKARLDQLRKEGKLPAVEHDADGNLLIKRVERTDREGRTQVREDVRVRVTNRAGEIEANPEINVNTVIADAFGDMKWAGKASTKDLGTRDFDGIKAEGKLRSYEIPAGAVGNKNPITVSDETWYAPDLQVTVYSRHSDPRAGDNLYRLANIKREEPAAALFSVPPDYTVKDAMAKLKKSLGEKK
jgi:hypothetical protein